MKNFAAALVFLLSVTGVVHTLEARAASAVQVNPGISAPVALSASFSATEDAPDAGDLENKKKKKKKRKGGEESEEEYRFTSRSSLDALQAMLVVSTAAVGPVR